MAIDAQYIHLRAAGVSVLIDAHADTLPRIIHWGQDLGDFGAPGSAHEQDQLKSLVRAAGGAMDFSTIAAPLPQASDGWVGANGLEGHREGGVAFSPRFEHRSISVQRNAILTQEACDIADQQIADTVTVHANDAEAGLELNYEVQLLASGVVRHRATLTNTEVGAYQLNSMLLSLPLAFAAQELLDFTGRWIRERAPQRSPFTFGAHTREMRKGRGHDATVVMIAGETGFTYETGEVWGVHVAWSANHRITAEREVNGHGHFVAGELLLPGEVALDRGESYQTPWVYGSYGTRSGGINELSTRFHNLVRSRKTRPTKPRPVHINVWEAVYFNHDLDTLKALADQAAAVGVERYVLDDGWFTGRRDDSAGLGDWYIDAEVWPNGLDPIIDHVTGLGMEFGLWFEPEMINEKSNLAAEHPDWILAPNTARLPLPLRNQQTLNLAIPQAYDYILERIDSILKRYAISYVKWDHNREILEAGNQHTGQASVHEQTLALYRLLGELKARHPHVEFETCAGGGGRVDLAILAYADRMWASDCIDALERQQIEAGTSILVPPEVMGSHIGSGIAHTTGRRHTLAFRASTALFGHMGIEWNLNEATEQERGDLATWIELYKTHRELLHNGTVQRLNVADPQRWVHGVVAPDASEALFASTQLASSFTMMPPRFKLRGLNPAANYTVRAIGPAVIEGYMPADWIPDWWNNEVTLSGHALMTLGLRFPVQRPEQTILIHLTLAG